MRHYGYPEKIVRILENTYRDTFSAVRVGGSVTEWFMTVVGVMQGDVLSPLLFAIFLEIIVMSALEDIDIGAWINGQRVTDLRFADDIAILAESENSLQQAVDSLLKNSKKMGLKINVPKTEVQLLGHGNRSLKINLEGQGLKQTEEFVYLGGVMHSVEGTEADVKRRIGKARKNFQMLKKIWAASNLSKALKVEVFEVGPTFSKVPRKILRRFHILGKC